MKARKMIQELQKFNPDAEVRLHHQNGNNALYVLAYENDDKTVVIADRDDSDIRSELNARFHRALDERMDELDFFMDLLDSGFTLQDIKDSQLSWYEYAKGFCEEHGLV